MSSNASTKRSRWPPMRIGEEHLTSSTWAALANPVFLHLINPYVILTFVFLIGLGFALNAPAWTSSVSEIVSNAELPSAATLGSLQLNISGIIGPALGGLLVAWIGPNFVFALNATCFLVVVLAILQWKRTTRQPQTGLESFFGSFVTQEIGSNSQSELKEAHANFS